MIEGISNFDLDKSENIVINRSLETLNEIEKRFNRQLKRKIIPISSELLKDVEKFLKIIRATKSLVYYPFNSRQYDESRGYIKFWENNNQSLIASAILIRRKKYENNILKFEKESKRDNSLEDLEFDQIEYAERLREEESAPMTQKSKIAKLINFIVKQAADRAVMQVIKTAKAKIGLKEFVQYHGPYTPKKNLEIFNECKKHMKTDPKCAGFMKKFEEARDRYVDDRNGGKDFNDSMLAKPMKACEKHRSTRSR